MTLTQRIAIENAMEAAGQYASTVTAIATAPTPDTEEDFAAMAQQAWDDLRSAIETVARA